MAVSATVIPASDGEPACTKVIPLRVMRTKSATCRLRNQQFCFVNQFSPFVSTVWTLVFPNLLFAHLPTIVIIDDVAAIVIVMWR